MRILPELIENNRRWAQEMVEKDAGYFARLADHQKPEFLWIGCSDSRVPANQIVGLDPGEVFVHRNIANVVVHSDFNCLSVIEFAVEVLKVKHVIVCGHYGCGGVAAAMQPADLGLLNGWLREIRDVYRLHQTELDAIENSEDRFNRFVELNVKEQVENVSNTTIVQKAWKNGAELSIHGWIYNINNGILKDLDTCKSSR